MIFADERHRQPRHDGQGFLEAEDPDGACAFTKCSPAGANRVISKASLYTRL